MKTPPGFRIKEILPPEETTSLPANIFGVTFGRVDKNLDADYGTVHWTDGIHRALPPVLYLSVPPCKLQFPTVLCTHRILHTSQPTTSSLDWISHFYDA